ncbi:tRNA pseudouridine synthase B [Anaerovirgula multivorans]|uniref:tRNA pseudouridine synthase B n=1 Tax=Anaerovirgula multivorans TaxID=312168 RepID=A0A238ZZQ9_9FIRM|nr:tRNA pseudouridine(55) synthase TruB [Anaerovirgula multivorans]SNR88875.1 tRNA pseudouridine synthase B [Anaerovirgula multivorans]
MKGILNILKPPEMTSHDVVAIVRRKTRIKKVGHTGTLDPNAAGVLPICIGQATKISQYLLDSTKKYRAELTLGITTDTQDAYGTVTNKRKVDVSTKEIESAVVSFIGEYNQIPPMYSALKIKGKKLYELARQGIEVARKPRRIHIESIDIINMKGSTVLFDVTCSKGTYIRTLCHDIGEKLGCGGIMSFLLRTATGKFYISSAITLEELEAIQDLHDVEKILKPIDYPLDHIARIDLDSSYEKAALNGNKIFLESLPHHIFLGDDVRVYINQNFIGIGTILKDSTGNIYIKFSRLFA